MEPDATGDPITEHPDPLDLPHGGCTDPDSDLDICATQCEGENYGRSMVSRQMYSKNFWVYKAVGANDRTYAKAGFFTVKCIFSMLLDYGTRGSLIQYDPYYSFKKRFKVYYTRY